MSEIVVEYSRFVEARQRRARIAEAFIHPPPEAPVATSEPESVGDRAIEIGISPDAATSTCGTVDAGADPRRGLDPSHSFTA